MAAHVFGTSLTDRDYERLERGRGIPRELAEQAQLRRVDTVTGREVMGVDSRSGEDYAGILIPYFEPGTDRVRSYRLRRDTPPVDPNGKADRKYLSAPGDRVMFYYPPWVAPGWLADTSLKILFVEGEFKALALWRLAWHNASDVAERPAFLPIGLGGINNWRGKIGKQDGPRGERQDIKGPIPDFDKITWKNREVLLVGDSNAFTNEDVRITRLSLAKHVRGLGAPVLFADIDPALGVNGIDDVCGQFGIEAALRIIESAYDPKKKADGKANAGAAVYSAEPQTAGEGIRLTEERLAQEFEFRYRDKLLYDHTRGRWYEWKEDLGRWVLNETRLAFHFARDTCRSLNLQEKKEFARASTYAGVERICQSSPVFAVTHELWDRDIWLLGTPGGVVDFRTGVMRPARREDYITKSTMVAPDFDAKAPVFEKFLDEITQSDSDLQRFLDRVFGSGLTGSTRDEKLIFLYVPAVTAKPS